MGLFKPIWMTEKWSKEEKAIAAVRQVTDPDKLYEIAVNAPLYTVSEAAVEGIEDDRLLARYAMTGAKSSHLQELALSRVKDQDLLAQIVLTKGSVWCRADMAAKYVKDPELLLKIASSDSPAAEECAHRLPDCEAKRELLKAMEVKARETARRAENPLDAQCRKLTARLETAPEDELHALIGEAYESYNALRSRDAWKNVRDHIERCIWGLAKSGNVALLTELIRDGGLYYETALTCIRALFSETLDAADGIDALRGNALEDFIANIPLYKDNWTDPKRAEAYHFVNLARALSPSAQEKYGFKVSVSENGCDGPDGHDTWESTRVSWRDRFYMFP